MGDVILLKKNAKDINKSLLYMKKICISDMSLISMCVAIISLFSWIYIPFTVNFTLQTLAIFVICAVFKLKVSIFSVLIYILLGACGLPIFSGFGAGFGTLVGPTGGYIFSFMTFPFIINLFILKKRNSLLRKILGMAVSIVCSYTIGTLWYYLAFGMGTDINFLQLLGICVLPFIIPDILKIIIAVIISQRLAEIYTN